MKRRIRRGFGSTVLIGGAVLLSQPAAFGQFGGTGGFGSGGLGNLGNLGSFGGGSFGSAGPFLRRLRAAELAL